MVGKGEPIVIASPEEGNFIEDISISNVKAYSENWILIYGKDNNIRNISLKNIDIYLSFGKNRPLFGKRIDTLPSQCPPFPDYMNKIPWIFAKDVLNLKLQDVNYGYNLQNLKTDFDIEGIFENVNNSFFSGIRKSIYLKSKV